MAAAGKAPVIKRIRLANRTDNCRSSQRIYHPRPSKHSQIRQLFRGKLALWVSVDSIRDEDQAKIFKGQFCGGPQVGKLGKNILPRH